MGLDFSVVPKYFDILLLGCAWTIGITVASAILSFFGGILFAVIALYAPWAIRQPFRLIAWAFMGTPLLLQLFLIYFGLVQIGIDLPAFVAGILGLGLHFAVYNSELIQTAILSVDKGQMEAARTVGLSHSQALRKVVIPQAVRAVIPPIGNNMIALLKDSAILINTSRGEVIDEAALVDAVQNLELPFTAYPIFRGDAISYSIAAASIVAKVTRDNLMAELAGLYPHYGLERNKGYGTAEHIEALRRYGACPQHRRLFVRNFIGENEQ